MAEMRVVPCPLCGRVAGQKAIRRARQLYQGRQHQLLDFDPDKPFRHPEGPTLVPILNITSDCDRSNKMAYC